MAGKPAFRMTTQRRVILDELRSSCSHPTADQLYERVRRRLPRISLGTVYRNLEVLAGQGVIQKLELRGAQRRFDGCSERHFHVRCSVCGGVADVVIKPGVPIERVLSFSSDFQITGVHLEFLGICPECRNRAVALNWAAQGHPT